MRNMDMVYAVYQYGSFSKAAEALYISQSSLSMGIQKIESEIGGPLFDRHQHPIRLTAVGEEYIQYLLKAKTLETDMLNRVRDLAELKSGKLVIGGTHYLLSYILRDTFVQFINQHPGVELKIVEAPSGDFKDLLENCDIDLCLKCDVDDPQLRTIGHAFFDRLYLAVPKDDVGRLELSEKFLTAEEIENRSISRNDNGFRLEDLQKLTFLQLTPGNNLYRRSEQIFSQAGVCPAKIVLLDQFMTAYNLAAAGLGCTLTSSRLITAMRNPNLVYYDLATPLMIRDFHFTVRKDAYISNTIQVFCNMFLQAEKAGTSMGL